MSKYIDFRKRKINKFKPRWMDNIQIRFPKLTRAKKRKLREPDFSETNNKLPAIPGENIDLQAAPDLTEQREQKRKAREIFDRTLKVYKWSTQIGLTAAAAKHAYDNRRQIAINISNAALQAKNFINKLKRRFEPPVEEIPFAEFEIDAATESVNT